jgi:hypothetical protein
MPKGYWKAFGQFLKGIGKPLGNAQILPSANRKGDTIAKRLLAKTWQFPFISSELLRFCLHLLQVEEALENFKNAQRFFSYFCSFQPYHL